MVRYRHRKLSRKRFIRSKEDAKPSKKDFTSYLTNILEHGEDAGLIIPYSCRAGMCGRCKAKLVSGEVTQLADDGLSAEEKQQGYILCCSAIAQSNVVIKHR